MSRPPKLLPRHGLVLLLVTAVLLGVTVPGLVWPGGTPALPGSAMALGSDPATAPQPSLVVAPESPLVHRNDEEFRFEVLVKNPAATPLGAGTVVLTIDNLRAETTPDLLSSTEREALELGKVPALETAAGAEQRLELTVSRDDFPLLFARLPGVYPVRASFTPAATVDTAAPMTEQSAAEQPAPLTLSGATPLVFEGVEAASPLPLTLVVPLLLPSSVQTLPNRDELARYAPQLLQVFVAAEQRHATVAIDPRILAGIRALGDAAPGGASTLLNRIERSATPMFLLQFADADPAVQAGLGFDTLLQPLGFSHATDQGSFEPPTTDQQGDSGATDPGAAGATDAGAGDPGAAVDPASPGASDPADPGTTDPGTTAPTDPDAAAAAKVDPRTGIPTRAGLLGLDAARAGAWPAEGEVDSGTLSLLQRANITSLVLDSSNVSNASSPRVTLGNFEALIADSALDQAARTALSGATAAERAAGAAELAGRLALSAQTGSSGAVLALDRGAFADATDPVQFLNTITEVGWVQPVSERLQPAGTAVLRAGAIGPSRSEMVQAAIAGSSQIDELAPLLQQPDQLLEFQRERLLNALATRYAAPNVDLAAVTASTQQQDDTLLQGVRPVISENTQLVGTLSHVPVTLTNALPFEAVVSLHATPTSAAISLGKRDFEVQVPATGSVNVLVPVHSRISSAETGLVLEVRDRAGSKVFTDALLPLTLRTTIETILMWTLGSAAALLLGFGIWRSVRRRRAAQSSAPGNGTPSTPDNGASSYGE